MLALAPCSMDHKRIVCPITDSMQRPETPPHHAPRRAGWDCWMLVVQKVPQAIPPLTRELIFSPSKVPLGGIVHIFHHHWRGMILGSWRRCTILGRMCANKYFANGRLTDFSLIADALISDYSVVRPILWNQISGNLGRIKWTSRIAVVKFRDMILGIV